MTGKKPTSRRVQATARRRMKQTGENYTAALKAVLDGSQLPTVPGANEAVERPPGVEA